MVTSRKPRHQGTRRTPLTRKKPTERVQSVTRAELSIGREVEYIIGLAQAREGRVVTLGQLVLFSTESGDAWMLDPGDGSALPLARDGDDLERQIEETEERFAIGWTHSYSLQGDAMLVLDHAGRGRSIWGYPVREIKGAIRRIGR
jgi:hypothetical protein